MEKGIEKLINGFEDVVPNDYHLPKIDDDDIVIGILTEEEKKICTYYSYLSDLLSERGTRDAKDEVANRLIFKMKVYGEILFYLIRERLDLFKYDENAPIIKKGFKLVLMKPDRLKSTLFEHVNHGLTPLSRYGD